MPSARLLKYTLGLTLWTMLLGSAPGCSSSDLSVLVTISNIPGRAKAVAVTATLDQKPLTGTSSNMLPLPLDQNRFGVTVPMAGRLALDVQALDGDNCTHGKAAPELDVAMGYSTLDAALVTQSPRRCGSLAPCAADASCSASLPQQTNSIRSVWSLSATDIWAVGGAATVMHFDGKSWAITPAASLPIPGDTTLYGVWASASNDVWAVGTAGRIIRYDGTTWSLSASGAQRDLRSISGVSGQNIWAVGVSAMMNMPGEFWHYTGSKWESLPPQGNGSLYAVWAVNPSFIIGAGENASGGILWVWDGASMFKDYSASAPVPVYGLWAATPSRAFAVGAIGEILRFDGASWQIAGNTVGNDLNAVSSDGTATYIVGSGGYAVRSTDQQLAVLTRLTANPALPDLWTVQPTSNGLVWLGGDRGYLGYHDSRP